MNMPQSNLRKVALLIESSRAYGRGLLQGIAAYAQKQGRWSLCHQEMALDAEPPRWLSKWKGDGVLVRAETDRMLDEIKNLGVPAVDLRCWRSAGRIPGFDTDALSVVKLAIDHLKDRGHRRFGFCGFEGANYSQNRMKAAEKYVNSLGCEFVSYESSQVSNSTTFAAEQSGMLDQEGLVNWLRNLKTPIGVLACNDIRAQQLLNGCHELQITVPDDIAVVGVDNDDVLCPLCSPPLTSVEPDTHRIGYEAASLLERMMSGETVENSIRQVPARGIVVRSSTDTIPVDDTEFVAAYRYIRENACFGVSVQEVADAVPMSRRALERRTRTYLEKSPAELIAEIRLSRVKELLQTTSHNLSVIARLTGFRHSEHMAKFFKKQVGIPPGKFRTNRLGDS
jgi:LacI family transcriptional regulator